MSKKGQLLLMTLALSLTVRPDDSGVHSIAHKDLQVG
jgi:hypothetical protein